MARKAVQRIFGSMEVMTAFTAVSICTSSIIADQLVWPQPPDTARVEYLGAIECRDLSPAGGFFSNITRWVGGRTDDEVISLPFDVLASGNSLFMVCQKIPALVEVERATGKFRLHRDKKSPMQQPISLCDGGPDIVFVTDPGGGMVHKFSDGVLEPFPARDLVRPTGIAALSGMRKLFIVDTGDHSLKIFDYDGNLLRKVETDTLSQPIFNYPTFAAAVKGSQILVNDGLNYEIKRFDHLGNLVGSFGQEGDGPGAFARPKGIAVDSDSHVYVVDNLFDNLQIFDSSGRVLLAIGSAGPGAGQFWSPAGIDIAADTIFIADTYNHRIQMLHYLGGAL